MSTLPDRELMRRLHSLAGTPTEILEDEDFVGSFLPVLRADLTMGDNYKYQHESPFDLPIWAFGGTEDQEVAAGELQGWRLQTRNVFAQRMFAGGHFYFRSDEDDFLRVFSKRLEYVAASSRHFGAGVASSLHPVEPTYTKTIIRDRQRNAGPVAGNSHTLEEE